MVGERKRQAYPVGQARHIALLMLLIALPASASASDSTSLFFVLLEVPMLVVSCIAVAICFSAPKGGLVVTALVLLANLMVLVWGAESGYTEDAGYLLIVSAVLQAFGVVVATKKLDQQKKSEVD